ncbi:hypothetical protein [Sphingomonas sp. MS122]|uniref:hypothetical protein n=1 Tax=Sphingomonas sp. MS122 TaxID=3412683 RepID=UPI003C2FA569
MPKLLRRKRKPKRARRGPAVRAGHMARSAGTIAVYIIGGLMLFGLLQFISTSLIDGWVAVIAWTHR